MPLTIVTGGGRGIGAAVVERLAAAGHAVVLGYRADHDAAAAVAERARASGAWCEPVAADVTTDDGVAALFAAADGAPGPLTGLVNNAGTTFTFAPLAETTTDVVRDTIALDLTAAILCARAAVRAMTASGTAGVIVNVSSGAATLGSPGEYVYYAAAKAGLDAFTMGLGKEVAPLGIRVVGVAPGLIDTTLHARTGDPGRVARMAPDIPLGRAGQPAEVADAVAFLMSEQAGYVTATTLRVAGGR